MELSTLLLWVVIVVGLYVFVNFLTKKVPIEKDDSIKAPYKVEPQEVEPAAQSVVPEAVPVVPELKVVTGSAKSAKPVAKKPRVRKSPAKRAAEKAPVAQPAVQVAAPKPRKPRKPKTTN